MLCCPDELNVLAAGTDAIETCWYANNSLEIDRLEWGSAGGLPPPVSSAGTAASFFLGFGFLVFLLIARVWDLSCRRANFHVSQQMWFAFPELRVEKGQGFFGKGTVEVSPETPALSVCSHMLAQIVSQTVNKQLHRRLTANSPSVKAADQRR